MLPLATALLGAAVALLLERSRRGSAREQWLLDRRHEGYLGVIDRASALGDLIDQFVASQEYAALPAQPVLGQPTTAEVLRSSVYAAFAQLELAQHRLLLVAPERTSGMAGEVVSAATHMLGAVDSNAPHRQAYLDALIDSRAEVAGAEAGFLAYVRGEFQPATRWFRRRQLPRPRHLRRKK